MKAANIAKVLNHIGYVMVAISNILCGCAISDLGQRYARAFHFMSGHRDATGHVVYNDNFPLPGLTLIVLPYVKSNAPIVVGFLIGITALALLLFLERSDENRKAWIPACLAAAFLLGFVPLIIIAEAMSLPWTYG